MKKILWTLMSLMFLFTSCSNEDEMITKLQVKDMRSDHFYGVKTPDAKAETKGVAQKDKLWYNGSTIKVKFLNGSESYQQKVMTYAAKWERYANITFQFVEITEKANVRIGFDWNDERYITWSYIGTDCKMVRNQNEATMNFSYFDSASEEEIKGDVLRAFGQVLGLELEHRHLEFTPGWTNRISDYWEGELSDIPWDDLQEYVFDPLEANNVIQTKEYDQNSIMIWPFTRKYAANTARDFNYELSQADIEFVKQLYPKPEEEAIVTMTAEGIDKGIIRLKSTSDISIDWGDGTIESIGNPTNEYRELVHTYKSLGNYTINFYGDTDALQSLIVDNLKLTELDVSKNIHLENLTCNVNKLSSLHISNNLNLRYLDCSYNQLTEINTSTNEELESLECTNNQLTKLELVNNTKLSQLHCMFNQLTELDVSLNYSLRRLDCSSNKLDNLAFSPELVFLFCGDNRLGHLNLSGNRELMELECSGNRIEMLDISENTRLQNLFCHINNLSEIDVSNNLELRTLDCTYNRLSKLDVSNNTDLETLYCSNNELEQLIISEKPKLRNFFCYENPFIISDQDVLVSLINLLPNRNGQSKGMIMTNELYSIEISNPMLGAWIREICKSKNWDVC